MFLFEFWFTQLFTFDINETWTRIILNWQFLMTLHTRIKFCHESRDINFFRNVKFLIFLEKLEAIHKIKFTFRSSLYHCAWTSFEKFIFFKIHLNAYVARNLSLENRKFSISTFSKGWKRNFEKVGWKFDVKEKKFDLAKIISNF